VNPITAITATTAMAATVHGTKAGSGLGCAPSGAPQAWQNRAPGESAARQVGHAAPRWGAPQLLQKLPLATWPQRGHRSPAAGVVDWGMIAVPRCTLRGK
jgi:hypothetical protein